MNKYLPPSTLRPLTALLALAMIPITSWANCTVTSTGTTVNYQCGGSLSSMIANSHANRNTVVDATGGWDLTNYSVQILASTNSGASFIGNNITSSGLATATTGNGVIHMASGGSQNASIDISNSTIRSGNGLQGLAVHATGSGNASLTARNTDITFLSNGAGSALTVYATGSGHVSLDVQGGTVSTMGNMSGAVVASSGGNVTINTDNTINVNSNGSQAYGITARTNGTGNIDLTNAGQINMLATTGQTIGIQAQTSGSGYIHIKTSSDIHVASSTNYSYGVLGYTTGSGPVQVDYLRKTDNSLGTVSTVADYSHGIYAYTMPALSASAGITINAAGNIETHGTDSSGIRAWNYGNSGDVSVNFTDGHIQTYASDADGIIAAQQNGSGKVSIKAAGTIDTASSSGSNAYGIVGWTVNSTNTGNIDIEYTGQQISTNTSTHSSAIQALQNGSGQVSITNSGQLTTRGDVSHGIGASATTGSIYLASQGQINTSGAESIGIYGTATTGDIEIVAAGNITTANASTATGISLRSHGIFADSAAANYVKISYDDINGSISVAGSSTNDFNMVGGIRADTRGTADASITVQNINQINMSGNGSAGLVGRADPASTGDVIINFLNGQINNTGAGNADGINAENTGSGNITVNSFGNVTINGNNGICGSTVCGSEAIYAAGNADVTIQAKGTVQVNGTAAYESSGILAYTGSTGGHTARVTFDDSNGSVTTMAQGAVAIRAIAAANGNADIQVSNARNISTQGDNAAAIQANAAGSGTATIIANGNINTAGNSSAGVYAFSQGANASATVGGNLHTSGTGADGVFAGSASTDAAVTNYAAVDANGNLSRGLVASATNGQASIDNYGAVHSATRAMYIDASQSAQINHHGLAGSLDDFVTQATAANQVTMINTGTITGYAELSGLSTAINNAGIWNLRHLADTNGDGTRDTLGVAVIRLNGTGNHMVNSGTIALNGGSSSSTVLNNSGEYLTGYAANTMTPGGAVQGQILGVQTFTNSGIIDMGDANNAAGDVLLISGGYSPGVTGGGVFIADGGLIKVDTVLNAGDSNSQSDMLVVDSTRSGSAATEISVKNTGGAGAATIGNGIELIRVLDRTQSAANVFKLSNRVVAGIYEYDLHQHGVDASSGNGNWYLRSLATPRPETGVYLRNMSVGSTMFLHTLHDRMGEPQYTDASKNHENTPSGWVRIVGSRSDSKAGNGQINLDTETSLIHFGGDIARWGDNGDERMHFGLMGAYGRSDVDAESSLLKYTNDGYKRTASGKVDGYSIGAYFTWYQNKDKPTGPYLDLWTQYAWYENKVQGNTLKEEKYNSTGWTLSVEGGHAFTVGNTAHRQWMLEPQLQIAYNSYSADDHKEASGTWVRNGDEDGVIGRLGARFYSRSALNDNGIQPFVEANWWYSSLKNSLTFNDVIMDEDIPDSRYELKAGLQGEIAKGWQVWGHIGGQWGENSYSRYEGMVGIKHLF